MVYRTRRKTRVSHKRRSYGKKKAYSRSLAVPRSMPFGVKKLFKTRYVERFLNIDPGAVGAAADYVFGANCMYDPNITGVGHQPYGFDEMMAMFGRYTVIGSKISVMLQNTDASYPVMAGLYINNASTAATDLEVMMEGGRMRWKTLGPAGLDSSCQTISMATSIKRQAGVKDIMDNDAYAGSANSNPSKPLYFHVIAAPNSSVNPAPLLMTVIIDFVSILTVPQTLSQS